MTPICHLTLPVDRTILGNTCELTLDNIKIHSQSQVPAPVTAWYDKPSSLIREALNTLLFYTYNRNLEVLEVQDQSTPNLLKVCLGGAIGGLASFVILTLTEKAIKCFIQVTNQSS
ncbi:hypothetical protein BDZ91DRAFT_385956 [Kalaharituber pfeilii]|nr:hypothetical protein BDZ91DRAFT_385956 [Kalaharituber pfeilii]